MGTDNDLPTWAPGAASSSPNRGRSGLAYLWWLVAGVLVLVAAGCFAVGLSGQSRRLAGPAAAGGPAESGAGRVAAPLARPAALGRSVPLTLRIPAIGLSAPLSELGLNADGTVEVPTDFGQPGWFRLGPSPGQRGSAVILGHVDSFRGPAVFFRLRSLRAGDRVEVGRADRIVAVFTVNTVTMYPKDQFPARLVYGPHGYSALQLVTCGGTFDPRSRGYLSNLVVSTSLTATSTTPPSR